MSNPGRLWTVIGAVLLALTLSLVSAGSSTRAPAVEGSASIPSRLAGYSHLTGTVSASPPGRALVLFQHGFGVELFDFEQAVVLGADGDAYRRLDVAEDRAGPETQGDPAPMLLSPDGTSVAVGDWRTDDPEVAIVDLLTGEAEERRVPGERNALPIAWSPDSTRVAYLTRATPSYPYSGHAVTGEIGTLDAETGDADLLPGAANVRAVAFSPRGTEMAVHRIAMDTGSTGSPDVSGGDLEVVGFDGDVRRQLRLAPDQYLAGPAAWSPDGALLAMGTQWRSCRGDSGDLDSPESPRCVAERDSISFVDASGRGAPTPPPLTVSGVSHDGLMGWAGSREVLVLANSDTTGQDGDEGSPPLLMARELGGGEPRRLSVLPGGGDYGVGSVQVAAALLPDLQVREPGRPDRGPWPAPVLLPGAAALVTLSLLAARVIQRRRRTVFS